MILFDKKLTKTEKFQLSSPGTNLHLCLDTDDRDLGLVTRDLPSDGVSDS